MSLGTGGLVNVANVSCGIALGLVAEGGIGGSSLHMRFPAPQHEDVFDAILHYLAPIGLFFLSVMV